MFFTIVLRFPDSQNPPKKLPKVISGFECEQKSKKGGSFRKLHTKAAQASDEMREAIGLRALLRSTEFLGIFCGGNCGRKPP